MHRTYLHKYVNINRERERKRGERGEREHTQRGDPSRGCLGPVVLEGWMMVDRFMLPDALHSPNSDLSPKGVYIWTQS